MKAYSSSNLTNDDIITENCKTILLCNHQEMLSTQPQGKHSINSCYIIGQSTTFTLAGHNIDGQYMVHYKLKRKKISNLNRYNQHTNEII